MNPLLVKPVAFKTSGPVNQIERPLLARVAESVYWCARYVERAEHIARVALVTGQVGMDTGDLEPQLRDRLWLGALEALELGHLAESDSARPPELVMEGLLNPDQPGSITSCITAARDNARSVRGEISNEMWQVLNELYWNLRDDDLPADRSRRAADQRTSDEFFQHLIRGSLLFQGVTDQTLAHGQRWNFAIAGRMLERADATCRIIGARSRFLADAGDRMETPLRNIHLMAALRMCGCLEAYRRQHHNRLDVQQVAGFTLLQADNPRSVRHAVEQAHQAVERIADSSGVVGVDQTERVLGRLVARLEYAEVDDIAIEGAESFLAEVRRVVSQANEALHRRYFMG